jgi:D-beta-D-heptose 7-phosphate kinase/D-beta-D-heptose 1-phosphate adenosyltransferase
MKALQAVRILVVGDIMLDEYLQGVAHRISPEAPVPVLRVNQRHYTVGGAANVAANIRALGCDVHLLGCVGADEAGETIRRLLTEQHIDHTLITNSTGTIHKVRLIGQQGLQMLRYDLEESVTADDAQLLEKCFQSKLTDYDAVVFSDYAKGSLQAAAAMIQQAKQRGKTVFVDPKNPDVSVYRGADYLKPNSHELRAFLNIEVQHESYEDTLCAQMAAFDVTTVLHTRGEHGMALYTQQGLIDEVRTDAVEVFDVTGAGDTVMAVFAVSIMRGNTQSEAMRFANKAAGIVVKKHGVATACAQEVFADCARSDTTIFAIAANQKRGARIVMTNGCFDILHAGHVDYLSRAKALGDILVVAINSDASITQLKGPTRPINTLTNRMRMLLALQEVDYVVVFDDLTPQAIIETIAPDVLVKGADYTVEEIVGGDTVRAYGGKVCTIPLVPGLSTTALIERAQQEKTTVVSE